MRKYTLLGLVVVICGSFLACVKRSSYPVEPAIKFLAFEQTRDTAYLRFTFTDGDGDLGLNSTDTLPPYNSDGNNYYTIYVKYYESKNGNFEEIQLPAPFNYRFQRITSPARNNSLEGEMKIKIPAPYYNPFLSIGDTVKYEFFIKDRALHSSNIESTGPVVIRY